MITPESHKEDLRILEAFHVKHPRCTHPTFTTQVTWSSDYQMTITDKICNLCGLHFEHLEEAIGVVSR